MCGLAVANEETCRPFPAPGERQREASTAWMELVIDILVSSVALSKRLRFQGHTHPRKPQKIVEKMVDGRVRKYLAEISLTEQPFVKDSEKKIGELCSSSDARIIQFVRYEVGEGIEKDEDDFAAEVQRQLGD